MIAAIINSQNKRRYIDPLIAAPTRGLATGDSTVADWNAPAVLPRVITASDITAGWSYRDITHAGDTFDQQLVLWNAVPDKTSFDWIIMELGLNDCAWNIPTATAIADAQALIDAIRSGTKAGCKILIGAMSPARARWEDVYPGHGAECYTNYLALQEALMGNGSTPVTGADLRFNGHNTALSDINGNLLAMYDAGDHIHPNDAGRDVIATYWRSALHSLNLI